MKSCRTRALLGLAVAFLLTPAALCADEYALALVGSDLYSAPLPGARSLTGLDDLITINTDTTVRRGPMSSAESSTATSAESAEAPAALESPSGIDEGRWMLGAFGAILVMGLGITVAGVYWSGPRALTRW